MYRALGAQLRVLKMQIFQSDRMINAWHRLIVEPSKKCCVIWAINNTSPPERINMIRLLAGLSLLLLAIGASAPAQAKGCIKGALIGGTAGHFAGHHGVIGALAGCAIGRHEANNRAQPNAPRSSYGQVPAR